MIKDDIYVYIMFSFVQPQHTSRAHHDVGDRLHTYVLLIIQFCSGITRGRVLNGKLYAQRLQKLIYLHLFTDCFMKISLQSYGLGQMYF